MRLSKPILRASSVSAAWRMVGQSDWLPMMIATGLAAMHALCSAPAEKKAPYRGTPSREASGYASLTMSAHRSGEFLASEDHGEGECGQDQGHAGGAGARVVRPGCPRRARAARCAAGAQHPLRTCGSAA